MIMKRFRMSHGILNRRRAMAARVPDRRGGGCGLAAYRERVPARRRLSRRIRRLQCQHCSFWEPVDYSGKEVCEKEKLNRLLIFGPLAWSVAGSLAGVAGAVLRNFIGRVG